MGSDLTQGRNLFCILLVQPLTYGRQAPSLNTVVWSCTHHLLSSETILGQLRQRSVHYTEQFVLHLDLASGDHTHHCMHSTLEWTVDCELLKSVHDCFVPT